MTETTIPNPKLPLTIRSALLTNSSPTAYHRRPPAPQGMSADRLTRGCQFQCYAGERQQREHDSSTGCLGEHKPEGRTDPGRGSAAPSKNATDEHHERQREGCCGDWRDGSLSDQGPP